MGNQLQYSAPKFSDVQSLLIELTNLSPEGEPLKSTKLFKSIICTLTLNQNSPQWSPHNILVLAKVYIRRDPGLDGDLSPYKTFLDQMKNLIKPNTHPNLLVCDYLETKKVGVLIRPYVETTLRQRLARQPALSFIEKLWISLQIMHAVFELHSSNIIHGDINSENFLVTSWNWIFLSDVSSFYKPTHLLEGDLTSYKSFFSSSKREACCIAPERFMLLEEEGVAGVITGNMDIFSLGCTIAEVFNDGVPLFSLSSLLSYQRGNLSVDSVLENLKDQEISGMIKKMICLEPEERMDITECLNNWNSFIGSLYFAPELHTELEEIVEDPWLKNPDNRITMVWKLVRDLQKIENKVANLAVLVPVVTSSLRNTSKSSVRIQAIDLLLSISKDTDEFVKLHRILPFLISLIETKEEKSCVKVAALKAIISLLQMIKRLEPKDAFLFQEYIWPSVCLLKNDEDEWIEVALAEVLPELARIAKVFLEISRYARQADSELAAYDKELENLYEMLLSLFRELLENHNRPITQKKVLSNFEAFARNFNSKIVLNRIFSVIFPFLNKEDTIKQLIFQEIPKLTSLIKSSTFIERLLPVIEVSLEGRGEMVMYYALQCISKIPELIKSTSVIEKAVSCLVHPNHWIRSEATNVLLNVINHSDQIENYCYIRPILIPFLTIPPKSVYLITKSCVEVHIKKPFLRKEIEKVLSTGEIEIEDMGLRTSLQLIMQSSQERSRFNRMQSLKQSQTIPVREMENTSSEEEPAGPDLKRSQILKLAHSFYKNHRMKLRASLMEHEAAVTELSCSETSLFSASSDGSIKRWEFKQFENLEPVKCSGHMRYSRTQKKTKCVGLEAMNSGLVACYENRLMLVDSERFEEVFSIENEHHFAKILPISESGLFTVNNKGMIEIYDVRTKQPLDFYNLDCQRGIISAICQCHNSMATCIGTYLGYYYIFDLRFNILSKTMINSSDDSILSLESFHPDPSFFSLYGVEKNEGPMVLAATGSEVVTWDLFSGKPLMVSRQALNESQPVPHLLPEPESSLSLGRHEENLPNNILFRKNLLKKYSEYTSQASLLLENWANCSHRIKKTFENPLTVRTVKFPVVNGTPANYILTGSQDSNLRLWNFYEPVESYIFGESQLSHFHSLTLPDVIYILEENRTENEAGRHMTRVRQLQNVPMHRKTSETDAILDIATIASSSFQFVFSASRDGSIHVWS